MYKKLFSEQKEFVMSKQLLRSATSVGANISEANYAVNKAEFIVKMQIALKEVVEAEYWLTLPHKTGYITTNIDDKKAKELCSSFKHMLIATLNTCKKTQK